MNNRINSDQGSRRYSRHSRGGHGDFSDQDIYRRHYERDEREEGDPRRFRSGPANRPNYGRPVYEEGPEIGQRYGYNQGRNAASNIGGRAYGQNYGQYFQGSDWRENSNSRDYQGEFDEYSQEYRRGNLDDYPPEEFDAAYYDRNERDRSFRRAGYYTGPHDNREYSQTFRQHNSGYPDYREEGYANYGHTEGFGQRPRSRNDRNWFEEDEYRRGHARRQQHMQRYR